MAGKPGGKGSRKLGRKKKKTEARGKAMSLYVRDKISFGDYLVRTKQTDKERLKNRASARMK
jgi:hypothetical protein